MHEHRQPPITFFHRRNHGPGGIAQEASKTFEVTTSPARDVPLHLIQQCIGAIRIRVDLREPTPKVLDKAEQLGLARGVRPEGPADVGSRHRIDCM